MKTYDLTRELAFLRSNLGLKRDFEYSFDKAASNNALLNVSDVFVDHAIPCIFAGWHEEAGKLLIKAKQWIEASIDKIESTGGLGGTASGFHQHLLATISWLCDGKHDERNLNIWLHKEEAYFRDHPEYVQSPSLGLVAVTFINAGGYEEYMTFAAPEGLDSIKCSGSNEKQMCRTLAAQALTQKFPEDKVQATVKKFLDSHVNKWLNDGHAIRAAEWMKVIYWKRGESGISPFDAVRKCLDHLEKQ